MKFAPHSSPHRFSNRISAWQKRFLFRTMWSLFITGLVWLALHYWIQINSNGLPHPAESWLMKAHGLLGFFALFSLGMYATVHIPRGWQHRQTIKSTHRHWTSALVLLGMWIGAILTAYLLYYFAPDDYRPQLGWLHAALGIGLFSALKIHSK